MLIAYTDGSTWKSNPGPMSWAVVYVRDDEIVCEETGSFHTGTNNRAELMAVIWAMERYGHNEDLLIRTDSTLTANIGMGVWQPRTNLELWERFAVAIGRRERKGLATQFQHVKGHAHDPYNRRADWLARKAAQVAAECVVS